MISASLHSGAWKGPSMHLSPTAKRDFIRMRIDTEVSLLHEGQVIAAVCLDLSSSGMQVQAPQRFRWATARGAHRLRPPGSKVDASHRSGVDADQPGRAAEVRGHAKLKLPIAPAASHRIRSRLRLRHP
jgi:hypothetical protein